MDDFRTEMKRLAERQSHLEGARTANGRYRGGAGDIIAVTATTRLNGSRSGRPMTETRRRLAGLIGMFPVPGSARTRESA